MIDKLKKANELRKLQKDVERLKKEVSTAVESGNYKVIARGDGRLVSILENGEEKSKLKEVINDALKTVEKKANKKMEKELRSKFNMSDLGL